MCSDGCPPTPRGARPVISTIGRLTRLIAKVPIHVYRWTLKPLFGMECRHDPTCSAYALEAIELNGPWRGLWLAVSRIWRCSPWGTAGIDPAPDIRAERHPLMPWLYGRWTKRGAERDWRPDRARVSDQN